MKIYIKNIILAATSIFFIGSAQAQKKLTEGTVTYGIAIINSGGGAVPGGLNGAEFTLSLRGDMSRTEMTSSLGSEVNVYREKDAAGYILKNYSGQKLMISLDKKDWSDKNEFNSSLKFKTEGGTSIIAGYSCNKAVATGGNGKEFTVYYTSAVTLDNKTYNNAFTQLKGLPVQYELKSGNLTFVYTLKGISYDPVSASLFEEPKAGYRVMTYEENQQLKKGN